jgi:caffeoyl-CoA O-methyltransferase
MDFIPEDINEYCEKHTNQESEALKSLNRHTNVNILRPRMLSGHLQGQLLRMLSSMIKPKRVLEIGTYTGYSAICLAEGIAKGGELITVDCNEELEDLATSYFKEAGYEQTIKMLTGDATEVVNTLSGTFDLVFIDADKESYVNYYHQVFDKVNAGGYIIVDNVLWSGKVVEELKEGDKETQSILDFNAVVQADERVENILLPFRDGLMILQKK